MGEVYWAEVTLTIPFTMPDPFVTGFDATTFSTDDFLDEIFCWECSREDLSPEESVEYDRLHALIDEVTSWAIDCEQVGVVNDDDGSHVTLGGEHNYGIAYYQENTNLEEVCQANGIAYVMRDEGKHELEGEEVSWAPGRGTKYRSVLSGGAVALNEGTAKNMWERTEGTVGRLLAFAQDVLDYFEITVNDQPPTDRNDDADNN